MFILQNQNGYFLSKSGQWVDGRELNVLYRTIHRDEAVNYLFETNSKDYSLRISILSCDVNPKNLPIIPDELLPPPLPKTVKAESEQTELDISPEESSNNSEYNPELLLVSDQHA